MIDLLIDKLSQRFRSENDLSDITWGVAETAPEFQEPFSRFFFSKFDESENIVSFVREFTNDDQARLLCQDPIWILNHKAFI
jgi:hypothetical protein